MKAGYKLFSVVLVVSILLMPFAGISIGILAQSTDVKIYNLQNDWLTNPIGIDIVPTFSWKLSSGEQDRNKRRIKL